MAGKAKKTPPRGRKRKRQTGDRLNVTQLALRIGHDRGTVSQYLKMAGAPKPDAAQRFDVKAARRWIESVAPKLNQSQAVKELREKLLRLEVEERETDLAVRRGSLVKKETIEPAVTSFCSALVENLRTKFEFELPAKYEGLDLAARAKLNADGIDWVVAQLKSATAPLTR